MSPADAAVAVADADSQALLHQVVPEHAFACQFRLVFRFIFCLVVRHCRE